MQDIITASLKRKRCILATSFRISRMFFLPCSFHINSSGLQTVFQLVMFVSLGWFDFKDKKRLVSNLGGLYSVSHSRLFFPFICKQIVYFYVVRLIGDFK